MNSTEELIKKVNETSIVLSSIGIDLTEFSKKIPKQYRNELYHYIHEMSNVHTDLIASVNDFHQKKDTGEKL